MIKKISCLIIASSMVIAIPFSVSAGSYTAIDGNKTTQMKNYLLLEEDANVPSAIFNYKITAASDDAIGDYGEDAGAYKVYAGVDADKITMAGVDTSTNFAIEFSGTDTTSKAENNLIKGLESKDKYVEKTGILDFSACNFTHPGIYRYVLTESGNSTGIINDSVPSRFIDVSVENDKDNANTLKITEYTIHSSAVRNDENDAKNAGFTNRYDTANMTVSATTSGTQGDKNKYFKYTFTLEGGDGTYTIDVPTSIVNDPDGTTKSDYIGKTNPTSITVTNGKGTVEFYMKDGDSVSINGVPAGMTYTLEEDPEGYKVVNGEDDGTAFRKTGTITPADGKTRCDDITYTCDNRMDTPVLTGVFSGATPFIIAAVIAVIGLIILTKKRKTIIPS